MSSLKLLITRNVRNIFMKNLDKYSKKLTNGEVQWGSDIDDVEFVSTGMVEVDHAMGGGVPLGRMMTVKGLPSVTKTSFTLTMLANAQREGYTTIYVDAEHALNKEHAKALGVDMDKLVVITPYAAEESIDIIENIIRDEQAIIVIDSASALVSKSEAESDAAQQGIATQARIISRTLRRLAPLIAHNKSTLIWVNQLRMNIAAYANASPYIETGGKALQYYASITLELKKKEAFQKDGEIVGNSILVRVTKNKVGPPNREVTMKFYYDSGFGEASNDEVLAIGVDKGVIKVDGRTHFHGETKLGTSKAEAASNLTDEMIEEIKKSA